MTGRMARAGLRIGLRMIPLFLAGTAFAQTRAAPLAAADRADAAAIGKQLGPAPYGELDLADPVHQRYFLKQLDLGGFSRAEYPMMFASIDAAQKTARAKRLQAGPPRSLATAGGAATPRLAAPASTDTQPIVPVVNIVSIGQDPYSQAISATVQLSVPNTGNTAPAVALTTLSLFDQNGNQIGTANGVSQNYAGFDVQNTVVGVPGAATSTVSLQGSYYYIDVNGAPHSGAISATTVLPSSSQTINNLQPTDVDGNHVIKVCVVRTDADCDYQYGQTGGQFVVKFPIQGNVTFPVALQPIANQRTSGINSVTITQPNPTQGGGCTLPANFDFWGNAAINGSVLSWNINPGPFSNPQSAPNNPCFPSNSTVIYNLFVTVFGTDNRPYMATITTDQMSPPPPNTLVIYPMSVAYGCVEEGSQVALPGGRSVAIETLRPGQAVVGAGGRTLEVRRLTQGDEAIPMVRITTADGHSLLLTETHPVLTADGPVMAKALTVGRIVTTATGASALTAVGREPGRKVWNIAFAATPAGGADEGFYANGVLVGDAAAQQRAELRERTRLAESRQQAIPVAWRIDADSARRRAAARTAGL